ncbi:MAG: hypothetical protein Q8N60_05955 [Candidatus Diapherotrites archaeon]|nr:hypothetical protein [Candidatus Diapherotrites archaeon]
MNKRNLCLMLSLLTLLFLSSNAFAEPNPFTMVLVSSHELDRASYYLQPQGIWYELQPQGGGNSIFNMNLDNTNENYVTFAYLDAIYTFGAVRGSDSKRAVFSVLKNGQPCGEPIPVDLSALSTETRNFLGSGCGFQFRAEWEYLGFTDVEIHNVWFTRAEIDQWVDLAFKSIDRDTYMKLRGRIDTVSARLRVLELTDPNQFQKFEGVYAHGAKNSLNEESTGKRNGVVITKNGDIKAVIRAPDIWGRDVVVYKPANSNEDFSIEKWNSMERIHGALDTKFIRVPAREGALTTYNIVRYVSGGLGTVATTVVVVTKGAAVVKGVTGALALNSTLGLTGLASVKTGSALVLHSTYVALGATGIGLAVVGVTGLTTYLIWDNTKLIDYTFDLDGDGSNDLQVSWDKELWVLSEAKIDLIVYLDTLAVTPPTPPTPPSGDTVGVWVSEHSNLPSTYDARNLQVKINGSDWTAVKRLGANKLLIYNLVVGSTYNAEYFLPGGNKITETIKPVQTLKKDEIDSIGV